MNKFVTYAILAAYAAAPVGVMAVGLNVGAQGNVALEDAVQIQTGTSANAGVSAGHPGTDDFGGEDTDSREAVVSLEGNTEILIKTEADLEAYSELVAENRESIEDVEADISGNVRVEYRQPARFLGVISAGLNAVVQIDSEAQVSVELPWYHFLFAQDATSVEAQVQADVDAAVRSNRVHAGLDGRVGTAANALNGARLVNVVSTSIEGSVNSEL